MNRFLVLTLVSISLSAFATGCTGGSTTVTTNTNRIITLPDGRAIKELGWRVDTSTANTLKHGFNYGYVTALDLSKITFSNPDKNVPANVTAEGLDIWNHRVRTMAESNEATVASVSANTEHFMYVFRFRRDLSNHWKRDRSFMFIQKNVGFHVNVHL